MGMGDYGHVIDMILLGIIIGVIIVPIFVVVFLFFKDGYFAEGMWEIKKAIGRFIRGE